MNAKKKKSREIEPGAERRVRRKAQPIRLDDLLPKRDVSGGGSGIVFGLNRGVTGGQK